MQGVNARYHAPEAEESIRHEENGLSAVDVAQFAILGRISPCSGLLELIALQYHGLRRTEAQRIPRG